MIKDNIAFYLKKKKWNQRDLADATGLTEGCISKIMNGITLEPEYKSMRKIAHALEVDIGDLDDSHLMSS